MAPVDIPAVSDMPPRRREARESVQAEPDDYQQAEPILVDPDVVVAEFTQFEKHLTGESVPLAKAAFLGVPERVTLFRQQVNHKRRELVRAEVRPYFHFRLTTDTSRRLVLKIGCSDCVSTGSCED